MASLSAAGDVSPSHKAREAWAFFAHVFASLSLLAITAPWKASKDKVQPVKKVLKHACIESISIFFFWAGDKRKGVADTGYINCMYAAQ